MCSYNPYMDPCVGIIRVGCDNGDCKIYTDEYIYRQIEHNYKTYTDKYKLYDQERSIHWFRVDALHNCQTSGYMGTQ